MVINDYLMQITIFQQTKTILNKQHVKSKTKLYSQRNDIRPMGGQFFETNRMCRKSFPTIIQVH